MGSSRVPGKAMIELAGKPLLWHILDRIRRVEGVSDIVVATTTKSENDILEEFANSENIFCSRHEVEDDLVGRVAQAIDGVPGDLILKAGGDCPLIDVKVLQKMVNTAVAQAGADFVSNRVKWSYPLGLSADVLSRRAIEWADRNLTQPMDRELFAVYIRDHPKQFKVVPIVNDEDLSHHTWTVDEIEDVAFVRSIFDQLYEEGEVFGMEEVLSLLNNAGS